MNDAGRILVRQYGPQMGSYGGIASVLGTYARLPMRRYRFRFVSTWAPTARLWGAWPSLRALLGLFGRRRWRHSIAHVHLSVGGSFVREGVLLVTASALGAPVVVSLHGGELADFAQRHPRLARRVLRRADLVLALGPTSRGVVSPYVAPGTPVVIVPNPVEVPAHPSPAGAQEERVLFAGDNSQLKGLDVLLEAWPRVRSERPDATLMIAGREGDYGPVPVPGVEWKGEVPRRAIDELLANSRLVVLPSRAEVMPTFVLEAMAAARPIVATPVGEVESMLGRQDALVPVGDADQLARAIVRRLADPDATTREGEELRRRAADRFSTTRVAELLEAQYDTFAADATRAGARLAPSDADAIEQ